MIELLDMKRLFAGIVLIVVLGLAGLLYRTILERPTLPSTAGVCTLEAKICPDGTSVGRSGPTCTFAECPFPNVSLDTLAIAFALPDGYVVDDRAVDAVPGDAALYMKQGTSTDPTTLIAIRDYPIPDGETAESVLLSNARLEPSDTLPKDMSAFKPKIIGLRTFSVIDLERFEGTVQTAYFFSRTHDVLAFIVTERNVKNWTSPSLISDNLPEHQALIKMLSTFDDFSINTPSANNPTSSTKE